MIFGERLELFNFVRPRGHYHFAQEIQSSFSSIRNRFNMGLIDSLNQLITEHGSATILKERLLLLRDKLEHLEKENQRLQNANTALQHENNDLKTKLNEQTTPDEFIKHRGMLFLRLSNGKIQEEVYCPKCRMPMPCFAAPFSFECDQCHVKTGFKGNQIRSIIAEIQ